MPGSAFGESSTSVEARRESVTTYRNAPFSTWTSPQTPSLVECSVSRPVGTLSSVKVGVRLYGLRPSGRLVHVRQPFASRIALLSSSPRSGFSINSAFAAAIRTRNRAVGLVARTIAGARQPCLFNPSRAARPSPP